MLRKHFPLIGLLLALLLASVSTTAVLADDNWTARYWNNTTLSGDPALVRTESELDHDWGDGSPNDAVNRDLFSARWTRSLDFAPGTYRFSATTDDGMRVWVDDNQIIDSWYDSQVHTVTADVFLNGGNHTVRVEYYDAGGDAVAKLSWSLVSNYAGSWQAQYYNNTSLSGAPARTQTEAQIDYTWLGSPASGVNADQFSVRWQSNLQLEPGVYRFSATADDGVRLYVNNQLVIDQWREQTATTYTADVTVSGGSTPVEMQYYEGGGTAVAALSWSKISSTPTAPPSPPAITNWRGEYYNNISLDGAPVLVRDDSAIDFVWGSSSPQPNVVDNDRFSVRWTRTLNLNAGTYTFTARTDDGVRVWVNDQLIIDDWAVHDVQSSSGVITVPGGAVSVRMEYFEMTGLAEAHLDWTSGSGGGSAPTSPLAPGTAEMRGAAYLNVRSGPSLSDDPIGYLVNRQVVTLLGRDPYTIWIKIQEADGTIGWASGRYLSAPSPLSNLPVIIE